MFVVTVQFRYMVKFCNYRSNLLFIEALEERGLGNKKIGSQTVRFDNPPSIIGTGSIVGSKEGQGRFQDYYDLILNDNIYGEKSWEKAESKMLKEAVEIAIKKQ